VTDRGEGQVLGLVLIAPVALGIALLVLWVGRTTDAEAQVQAASAAAAQAAARQRTPAAGVAAAQRVAAASLADASTCAGGPTVTLSAPAWRPGSAITVSVRCHPDRADLGGLAPRARELAATAAATIDPYRAGAMP
jgi:Flp pilus assembly protein TadG